MGSGILFISKLHKIIDMEQNHKPIGHSFLLEIFSRAIFFITFAYTIERMPTTLSAVRSLDRSN